MGILHYNGQKLEADTVREEAGLTENHAVGPNRADALEILKAAQNTRRPNTPPMRAIGLPIMQSVTRAMLLAQAASAHARNRQRAEPNVSEAYVGTAMPPSILQAKIDWGAPLPAEVIMILTAMDAGASAVADERRALPRMPYRRRAALRLFVDAASAQPRLLHIRDATQRGLGFVVQSRIPLGCGGEVELLAPNGKLVCVACTLSRCRQVSGEWFAGGLNFNRDQPQFAAVAEADADPNGRIA